MQLALAQARRALGRTSPNPPVGAVIVRDGAVVGEGHTQPAGSSHAEIIALQHANEKARGATMYVTLEPCCHFGRTPPCTRSIIAAGIAEVHAATADPNPLVAGQGLNELETAGIRVVIGEEEPEARKVIEGFAKFITTGVPFFILKWAMSIDGKIATRNGDSKWITGEQARAFAHDIRDSSDAVMVGVNTIIADDAQLNVRVETNRSPRRADPWRVVVDSTGRTPLGARVLATDLAGRTIVATTDRCSQQKRDAISGRGAEVLVVDEKAGRVDLSALARELAARGIVNVMVEGGATLLGALIEEGLGDKAYIFVAPKIVGGTDAPGPVGDCGIETIGDAIWLRDLRGEPIGSDFLFTGYLARGS